MGDGGNRKARPVLLAMASLWASAWLLADASSGNWLLNDVCCVCPLAVSTVLSLIPIVVAVLAYATLRLFKRRASLGDGVPALVVAAGLILAWLLPSRPAATFWLHRGEFLELVEWAVEECDASWWEVTRPPADLFDYSRIDCRYTGTAVVVYFNQGNSYLSQLVFISSDRPEDTPPCSYELGHLDKRLEAQWYVCSIRWD